MGWYWQSAPMKIWLPTSIPVSQKTYALPISAETLAKTGIVAKEVPEEINQCDRGQRKN